MRNALLLLVAAPVAAASLAACGPDVAINRNEAPVAEVGDDIEQPANLPVFLDGRSSFDADGDELTYFWSIDHAPSSSDRDELVDPFTQNRSTDSATTTFQPDAQGVYVIELITYDGQRYSDPAYLVVTALEPTERPLADAGNDQTLEAGGTATLDGGRSRDPLGSLLDYEWFLVSKPYNSALQRDDVDAADTQNASFTADVPGTYGIGLIVCSPQACSDADEVTLTFTGDNSPPVADAAGDFAAEDCLDIRLTCSGSTDPDNDLLFHWWTVQSVPEGSAVDNRYISDQTAAEPTIFFDVDGDYELSCSVYDGEVWSRPDVITVDVSNRIDNEIPLVDLGENILVDYGTTECEQNRPNSWSPIVTTCDKVGEDYPPIEIVPTVTDPDGDPFTLEWEVIRESKARLLNQPGAEIGIIDPPNFSPSKLGLTEDVSFIQLTATDCTQAKGRDELEIVTRVEGFVP